MADEIITREEGALSTGANAKFINTGKNGIQAETIGELNLTQQNSYYMIQVPSSDPMNGGLPINTRIDVDQSRYNLIVIEQKFSGHGSISLPHDRVLTKNISAELKKQFARLTPAAVETLKKYPTIIAGINEGQAQAASNQHALYGMITDILNNSDGIQVTFHYLSTIPQQRLNELTEKMAIDSVTYSNELDHVHWTVKDVNILKVFKDENIQVLIPSTM